MQANVKTIVSVRRRMQQKMLRTIRCDLHLFEFRFRSSANSTRKNEAGANFINILQVQITKALIIQSSRQFFALLLSVLMKVSTKTFGKVTKGHKLQSVSRIWT
jgi:hypothetical protein